MKKSIISPRKLYYGAALYPEMWDKDIIEQDLQTMQELHMNVVRIGEFMWSLLEPAVDCFDFSLLEWILERLKFYGMAVVVCTPTATPPRWMTFDHPERLHQKLDGSLMYHGSRLHICTNNAYFRLRAHRIACEIGKVVAKHDHVMAIQLDNEFKSHIGPCYCSACLILWQQWLEKKYKTIEHLNAAWGTNIWSQRYSSFKEVVQPLSTPFLHNSSLVRNYHLFSHDKINQFAWEQVQSLKKFTSKPITHNSAMGFDLDNDALFASLDFVSFDTYASAPQYSAFMINNDYWGNLKADTRDYILMETSPSHTGHLQNTSFIHPIGYVAAENFATYASGGVGFLFWLFRGQWSGCEQPHGSVITAWGEKNIGYSQALEVGNLKRKIETFWLDSEKSTPKVAITYSDKARLFFEVESSSQQSYRSLITDFYQNILDLGVERSLLPESRELDLENLLFTPYMRYMSKSFLQKGKNFVEQGGIWVLGPMTGDRTEEHTWHKTSGLDSLGEWLGIDKILTYVQESSPCIGNFMGEDFTFTGEKTLFDLAFMEESQPFEPVMKVGTVKIGQGAQKCFCMVKKVGKGSVLYLGALPIPEQRFLFWQQIFRLLAELGWQDQQDIEIEKGIVSISRQTKMGQKQYWIVNLSEHSTSWSLKKSAKDLLLDQSIVSGVYFLEAYQYKIIQMEYED